MTVTSLLACFYLIHMIFTIFQPVITIQYERYLQFFSLLQFNMHDIYEFQQVTAFTFTALNNCLLFYPNIFSESNIFLYAISLFVFNIFHLKISFYVFYIQSSNKHLTSSLPKYSGHLLLSLLPLIPFNFHISVDKHLIAFPSFLYAVLPHLQFLSQYSVKPSLTLCYNIMSFNVITSLFQYVCYFSQNALLLLSPHKC